MVTVLFLVSYENWTSATRRIFDLQNDFVTSAHSLGLMNNGRDFIWAKFWLDFGLIGGKEDGTGWVLWLLFTGIGTWFLWCICSMDSKCCCDVIQSIRHFHVSFLSRSKSWCLFPFFFRFFFFCRSLSRFFACCISDLDKPGLYCLSRRSRRILRAIFLFCCKDRVSWQLTRIPVGLWRSWTLFSVLLTDWPPGPLPRTNFSSRSSSLNSGITRRAAALLRDEKFGLRIWECS